MAKATALAYVYASETVNHLHLSNNAIVAQERAAGSSQEVQQPGLWRRTKGGAEEHGQEGQEDSADRLHTPRSLTDSSAAPNTPTPITGDQCGRRTGPPK